MASRFWVAGGTGNWSSTTNWSTTSGGTSGASVPGTTDDVFVNASSGTSQTITIDASSNCLSLDFTGAITPTLTGSNPLSIYGSLKFISTMTYTHTSSLAFNGTTTGLTVDMGGQTKTSGNVAFQGVGGGWTLTSAFTMTAVAPTYSFQHSNGTLNLGGFTLSVGYFRNNFTNTRTLTLGNSTINCFGDFQIVSTGLTLTAHTATINMTGNTTVFTGAGLTYNIVNFSGTPITVADSNTFSTVNITAGKTVNVTSGTTQTITSLVSNGTSASKVVLKALTGASAATISTSATINTSYLTVQDITKAGAGTITFNGSVDTSGNTGITFNNTLYWITGTGNVSDTTHWSWSSGGTAANTIPSTIDSARFDANSFSGAGQIVTANATFNCLDMDWTGATNTPTLAGVNPINVYGSLTFISAMIITFGNTIDFLTTTTGKTITTAGNALACSFQFDGVGGGWTLQDDLNTTTQTVGLQKGTLNTNGKSVSCSSFTSGGSSTRVLTLGSSVITASVNFTFSNTGITITANTATFVWSGSTFTGAGLTFNNLVCNGTNGTMVGSNTFNILTLNAGKTLKLTSGTTQTVTSFVSNGTVAAPSTLQSVTAASAATIALPAGRYFIRHTSVKDITVTGATAVTGIAGTNVSGNTGITFVTKFEMGRIKNDGSFNWYSAATGTSAKVSG